MKLYYFLVVFLSGYVFGNLVRDVHVVDPVSYIVKVITKTVEQVEAREWCNLKVPDTTVDVDETVLGWHAKGKIHYKNGFVVSIQAIDIQRSTARSQVRLNSQQQAEAVITGTLRMHDVAIGCDVISDLEDGIQRYTTTYVYPLINMAFTITNVVDTDNISVTVVGSVTQNRRSPNFMPANKATDVFTTLLPTNISASDIIAWGPDVFQPIATVVVSQVAFPEICFNCAADEEDLTI